MHRGFWTVNLISLLLSYPFLHARVLSGQSFDGKWWKSAAIHERTGYIEGDNDCYTFELHGKVRNTDPMGSYAKLVTAFYQRHASSLTMSVHDVLVRVAAQQPKVKRQDGEIYNEPHGYYDGLFWKQSFQLEQLGYVEGYLACYEGRARSPKATFSKPPSQYVSLISRWYKRTGEEDAKIATVLFKFRDGEPPAKAH